MSQIREKTGDSGTMPDNDATQVRWYATISWSNKTTDIAPCHWRIASCHCLIASSPTIQKLDSTRFPTKHRLFFGQNRFCRSWRLFVDEALLNLVIALAVWCSYREYTIPFNIYSVLFIYTHIYWKNIKTEWMWRKHFEAKGKILQLIISRYTLNASL